MPVAVLPGEPETAPWTLIASGDDCATFYAGSTEIALYRTETANYLDNLATRTPSLWVVLRPSEGEWPYDLHLVTADPAEGEAATEAGNDMVEAVAMPDSIREHVEAFVAEHHVEREFVKRKRDRVGRDVLGRRGSVDEGDRE
jgi:hypothetical protein